MFPNLRFTFRQLRKNPGFTVTAILSLALGIGATTAVFSVIYAILMDPYPYASPDRMVHMRVSDKSQRDMGFGLTASQWQRIRKAPTVEDAFISDDWSLTVTGHDLPEDVQGTYMTSNSFNFMGVPPALGRGLIPSDSIDGQDPQPVAVLSYKFWQRHFNSDRAVLGQTIQLVRKNYTIVGVAAPRFTWDDGDVYLPLKVTQDPVKAYYVGLRLKPGVTHEAANAALQPLIEQFAKETPKHFPVSWKKFYVVGLNENFVHQRRRNSISALHCGRPPAHHRLRKCLHPAVGARYLRQHELAVRTAVGRKPRPHRPPVALRSHPAFAHRHSPWCAPRLSRARRHRFIAS